MKVGASWDHEEERVSVDLALPGPNFEPKAPTESNSFVTGLFPTANGRIQIQFRVKASHGGAQQQKHSEGAFLSAEA